MPTYFLGKHVQSTGTRDQSSLEKALPKEWGQIPNKTQYPASNKAAGEQGDL